MLSDIAYNIYVTMINFWSWWWEVDNKQDEVALIVLTIFVPITVFVHFKWTLSYSSKHSLPGPYGLPILGYLPFLSPNLHQVFAKMSRFYGPIFSIRIGTKLHVVVNSIDLVKVITRDLDHTFANRNGPITAKTLTYDGCDIVWSNNNAHWRYMRKLLATQVLSKVNLNNSQSFRTHEVRKTVNHVYNKIGTKININSIAFKTEVNVVTSILWGGSKKSGEGKDSSSIEDAFHDIEINIIRLIGALNISDFLPFLSRFDLQGKHKEMKKYFEFVDGIFDNFIEERIKANLSKTEEDVRKDVLQILLELKDEKNDPKTFNITHIKALLMDIIVAATDTTSTMVEWVMAEILHHPYVMRKIQEELTTVIGMDKILEESHIPKLTYLDAAVKETFRLHPPLPLLVHRIPDESCEVGGYIIQKDSTVILNVWDIHRDPKNWTDPLEFKPERFLNDKYDYSGNNFKFLPFGTGRRICPGVPLGEKMLMYILASLLHSFEWSVPKDEEFDLSDEFGLVTKKLKPLIAIPSKRLSDASLYVG